MEQNNYMAYYELIKSYKNEDYLGSLEILSENPDIKKKINNAQLAMIIQYKQEKDISDLTIELGILKRAS